MNKIECKASNRNNITSENKYKSDDDMIDLFKYYSLLWRDRKIIIYVTLLVTTLGVVFSLILPNVYRSSVLIAPAQEHSQMGAMVSQLGGLASLAGIKLGQGGEQTTEIALASLTSRQFITHFINQHHLLPELMALKKWNAKDNKLIFDSDVYNQKTNSWHGHEFFNDASKPTASDAYKAFNKILSVQADKETGFISVSVDSKSPYLAQQWTTWLVEDINNWMKIRKIDSTKKNIQYLEAQLKKTSVTDMIATFNKLIEQQTKQLMLAEAQNEYAFQTIDKAVVPQEKFKPRRLVISVLSFILGIIFGAVVVLSLNIKRKLTCER
ncbi:Wzz/FepE/Etk N-terminal domain-containing protein [Vibrio sp. S4M6]|uniref:Wzz/FepE/Etk N-terminal domain-containing protein n=1 Tax=Vibrio sinus TaxID=2946865 RepID=UPI00202ABD27|nr:Wzz/FepE/Etk N-terminal domain-containing protein [Vibrio sinus]MCL9781303.1 Wzz/FepE/Etk N-terminal domain-containing protein [Vibrio sinus]